MRTRWFGLTSPILHRPIVYREIASSALVARPENKTRRVMAIVNTKNRNGIIHVPTSTVAVTTKRKKMILHLYLWHVRAVFIRDKVILVTLLLPWRHYNGHRAFYIIFYAIFFQCLSPASPSATDSLFFLTLFPRCLLYKRV